MIDNQARIAKTNEAIQAAIDAIEPDEVGPMILQWFTQAVGRAVYLDALLEGVVAGDFSAEDALEVRDELSHTCPLPGEHYDSTEKA